MFRLGRDRVEFERWCLTRRRGGAEKHAENIFSGLGSGLARLRRKVKTWDRGDSGDRTASQRGSRWGGRLTNAAWGGPPGPRAAPPPARSFGGNFAASDRK